MTETAPHVVIIGAGIGGLASALRLAHKGLRVTVLERHATPGGKMRTLPTAVGPVDAGPTVLTMKPVLERLFADVGERLGDHVTLEPQDILARHFWPDGTTLDLMRDPAASHDNVHHAFGARAAAEFMAFSDRARRLFTAFDAPMMQATRPTLASLTRAVIDRPGLIPAIAPHQSLAQCLRRQFTDPRLAQLFARYATYVGGLPTASPALLSLIWHAESKGVWHVAGGMHRLATAIAGCAATKGAVFRYGTHVTRIETRGEAACAVHTAQERIPADAVLFNGDPGALADGSLGPAARNIVSAAATQPRSLSAAVMSFAARPHGPELSAHNVFFADDPRSEYAPLSQGRLQTDPTLYVCAQDRFGPNATDGPERFEIILNAPALPASPSPGPDEKAKTTCQKLILDRLGRFGLTFSPPPGPETMSLPEDFARLFPGSGGALYGRSPQGIMAAFRRATARTAIRGLYLTGGGVHPGPGVPMATLSARHAAEAILADLPSMSPSRQADTPGGISTGSATTAPVPFRSSVS